MDNIHSNGRDSFTMDFGIGQQIGDVDFVPNGGGIQPGCTNRRKRSGMKSFHKTSSQSNISLKQNFICQVYEINQIWPPFD